MHFVTFLLYYGGGFSTFLFLMLFGEQPMFVGTPVATAHYLVSAAPCDFGWWLVATLCGARGEAALERCSGALCDSRNPLLQLLYLALVGGCYTLYHRHIFSLLPLPGLPVWHIYTGTGVLLLCLLAFVAASLADPGIITKANLAHYLQCPYDGVTNKRKVCRTCQLQRPARAKHCSACNACIARFDHHCGWINNCVGANNLRYFLAFLAANLVMTVYGSLFVFFVLRGELDRRRVRRFRVIDYDGSTRVLGDSTAIMVEWTVANYSTQVFLGVVLAAAALLMGCFLLYHLWLVQSGMTTYETYKWRDAALNAGCNAEPERWEADGAAAGASVWRCSRLLPRLGRQRAVQLPPNIYKQGLANLREVLCPGVIAAQLQLPPPMPPPQQQQQQQQQRKQQYGVSYSPPRTRRRTGPAAVGKDA